MLLLLSRITLAVVLAFVFQCVDGTQRTVYVIEPFSDDEYTVTNSGNASGGHDRITLCCKYKNGSYLSFDDALHNLTSNVLLNVTTDVILTSHITISNLKNVLIIGHNNPTVNCKGVGGIYFIFCHNCIIQGITWDGCGTNVEPGLQLSNSYNITIQNCSFQHSIGQAVVLSDISGDVNINHCKFVNNSHYRGHGAAISYSSNNVINHPPLLFKICNCNFTHNDNAKSYVYIKNKRSGNNNSITLCDSKFYHNQGATIYMVNYKLYLDGKILFQNNTANDGAGIYIREHATVTFERNSDVAFVQNSANGRGGAIFIIKYGNIIFYNSYAVFTNNSAEWGGGAIYGGYGSKISFIGNSTSKFTYNKADEGGAIWCFHNSIHFQDISTTEFTSNNAYIGGAIFSFLISSPSEALPFGNHMISFKDNSTTQFTSNNAEKDGGAICIYKFVRGIHYRRTINFEDNSITEFINNNANQYGGTIYSEGAKIITNGNFSVVFNDQLAKWCDNTCLQYTGEADVIIDRTGKVWCSDQTAFACKGRNCYCRNIGNIISNAKNYTSLDTVTISDKAILSSTIKLEFLQNIIIMGLNNLTVFCIDGGRLDIESCNNLTIEGISWIGCGELTINHSRDVIIQKCSFQYSVGQAMRLSGVLGDVNISHCKFVNNNHYSDHGTALYYSSNNPSNVLTINNCDFSFNTRSKSIIYIRQSLKHIYFNNCVFYSNQGASIYLSSCDDLYMNGEILFENNIAENGAGVYISDHSSVTFGENSKLQYINNSVHYSGAAIFLNNHSSVLFDKNSTVTFNDNQATNGTIYSKDNSNVIFDATCEVTFSSNSVALYGAAIHSLLSSYVTFKGNSSVIFNNNNISSANNIDLQNGGIIFSQTHSQVSFEGNSTAVFSNNVADYGTAIFSYYNSSVTFKNMSTVTFINNTVRCCGILVSSLVSSVSFDDNVKVTYKDNKNLCTSDSCYETSASGICSFQRTEVKFSGHSLVKFISNIGEGGAAVFSDSIVSIEDYSTVTFYNNMAQYSSGGAFSCYNNSVITIAGNSNVTFNNNKASQNGGAIHSYNMCSITFKDNSTSTFVTNTARTNGGALLNGQLSTITFMGNSAVCFDHNTADNGGVFYCINSTITSTDTSAISFSNNKAKQMAGVGYLNLTSKILFEGTTIIDFHSNMAEESAGVLFSVRSTIQFKGNSNITFRFNRALNGGAISANDHSDITIRENSILFFVSNEAFQNGGTFYVSNFTSTTINESSSVSFHDNRARVNGGVLHSINSILILKGNSVLTLNNNEAMLNGGAMCLADNSDVSFSEFTNITFYNNRAVYGGAILAIEHSTIKSTGNSKLLFLSNRASKGGVVYAFNMGEITFQGGSRMATESGITFKGHSCVTVSKNIADDGGAFYIANSTVVTFNESSMITFYNNKARQSGGVFYLINSILVFNENSTISLSYNKAILNGGAMYFSNNSKTIFSEFTNVTFSNNKGIFGGAVFAAHNSKISFDDYALVTFLKNEATKYGGAGYFNMYCNFTLKANAIALFGNNTALHGGALYLVDNTNVTFQQNSTANFDHNKATLDGGAISIFTNSIIMVKDYTNITFSVNNAQYGGAMYFDTTSSRLHYNNTINFINNTAKFAGKGIYFDSTASCNRSCLKSRIIGINHDSKQYVTTPPSRLVFYDPAICIDNGDDKECNSYFLNHVMLGQEINIPACVLDYFEQPADKTQFILYGRNNQNYNISGLSQFVISCGVLQGLSIIGNTILSNSTNYSIHIALHDDRNSNWKQISVNLTVELTPCYPGFWQYSNSQKCECYNASDIVFCSGHSSTIKRGYWFGSVTGNPTVTPCPINYCNFTCCETTNGYYHLSPVRDNQCRSHRSGTACGGCTHGYTLSFDSAECVNVESCTTGHMILVILLTVIYWIVIVILVFSMMYFKVDIGYLYSITYYYSIVDILLSQNLYASRELYLTVSIMSSFSKITPQFLGELCLTTGMSGIDQQFIHYIHPSAVILILVMISLLARRSRRFSIIIARGIIHVICCLLLLSYTSMASTSLLLMRPLKFLDVDKIYTYLSPDIEYFHGRHLAYGIVALLCTISIVIGLPLLLTLEPFLNHKINFIKIKPLLDQFQGCYKDKYRCFAGYYMICRLVIISIVIGNPSNNFIANYMLITVCGIIALIHVMVKPYNNEIINKFDGVILQLIIFIALIPWLDDFDSPFVITMAFTLIVLPLLNFIAVTLFLHKDDLKKITTHFTTKDQSSSSSNNDVSNNETPKKEFHLIIDENMRKNAIICEV